MPRKKLLLGVTGKEHVITSILRKALGDPADIASEPKK
jgi:hypothetical protein